MKKLIFLCGVMGSGKSHFTELYSKENGCAIIDYDYLAGIYKNDFSRILKDIVEISNNCDIDIIVDGYVDKEHLKDVKDRKIEYYLIYCNPEEAIRRFYRRTKISIPPYTLKILLEQRKVILKRHFDKIFDFSNTIKEYKDIKEITLDSLINNVNIWKKNKLLQVIEKWKTELNGYEYQGFNFPYDLQIIGMKTKNGEFMTDYVFNELKKHIDFKNKSLLDCGCYLGYYCLKAKEEGARYVSGLDRYGPALSIAKEISLILDKEINYINTDIIEASWGDYDIILLMNVLQHLYAPFYVVMKAFKHAQTVVIELDQPIRGNEIELSEYTERALDMGYLFRISKEAMDKFAKAHNFKLLTSFPSPKEGRVVLIYTKN